MRRCLILFNVHSIKLLKKITNKQNIPVKNFYMTNRNPLYSRNIEKEAMIAMIDLYMGFVIIKHGIAISMSSGRRTA